ncbi:MAG: radical SAM protein, partial [Acidobacteria bacterium]|nr:radical SAM protein [Acidobacteriota bacterium]
LQPGVTAFFRDWLAHEKVRTWRGRQVVNVHFPPYPSRAFDALVAQFARLGDAADDWLYSVTLAVTNRCPFRCWHCYNAGRSEDDLSLDQLRELARELQRLGAVRVTLTGGEPLLRDDLEQIVGCFDDRTSLIVGTTGDGLTPDRARRLADAGLFAVGISLDSDDAAEHDRIRGVDGAFRIALDGLAAARAAGLYPYVVTVAWRELLEPARFMRFMRFAGECGAEEVHLLEPSATGRLAGRHDLLLDAAERRLILDHQRAVAADESLPILSSFTYLESEACFGCGAGLTHVYIDGSGEVCPCNLIPLSFGRTSEHPLQEILASMRRHFATPRGSCAGKLLAPFVPAAGPLPTAPELSARLCDAHLPSRHAVPRFFRVRAGAHEAVGGPELRAAYDRVHGDYDAFWLSEAAAPVDDLVRRLALTGGERVLEAGCGTGYATAQLAARAAEVVAVDLSEGMLREARARVADGPGAERVRFVLGDALDALRDAEGLDVVFSSWVLGYIPLRAFFAAAARALAPAGRVAIVVHRDGSPAEPLEIFGRLVAREPTVLTRQVAFDFPRDARHLGEAVEGAGLVVDQSWEGAIVFRLACPEAVLEHLLKSGAGTAFHDALDPAHRDRLTRAFVAELAARHPGGRVDVRHDFVACLARRAPWAGRC